MAAPKKPKELFTNLDAFARVKVDRHIICAFLGCDLTTLDLYVKRGWVKKVGRGQFLLLEVVASVTKRVREMAAGRMGKDDTVDAAKANADLKNSQRKLVEARLEMLSGNLISLPEIEQS